MEVDEVRWSRSVASLSSKYFAITMVIFAALSLATLATAGAIGRPVAPAVTSNGPVDSAPVAAIDQNTADDPGSAPSQSDVAPVANLVADKVTTPTGAVSGDNPSSLQPLSSSLTLPPKKVGIQAGHWQTAQLPSELAMLRTSLGTAGGGVTEQQFNHDIATRVAAILQAQGVAVDVLPATIPPGYKADAFVAIHADGNSSVQRSGFKLARSAFSVIPQTDDKLLISIQATYAAATQLPADSDITLNMTRYFAFNNRAFQHAIAPTTPGVIVETGFLTSPADRRVLLGTPETVAYGIAQGILNFLAPTSGH